MDEKPVMFPPGRARLATKPDARGSPTNTTTGMVVVARFTASATITPGHHNDIDLTGDRVGHQFAQPLDTAVGETVLDDDVATFLIA
jgi:hypothetical protein